MENIQNTLPQSVVDAKNQGHTVFAVENEEGERFYLRQPNKQEILLFQDSLAKSGTSMATAQEKFVRSLFVGDNAVEFDAFINAKPFAVGSLFTQAVEDLGMKENFTKTTV